MDRGVALTTHPPPPHPSAEVKEGVEMHLHSPLGLRGLYLGKLNNSMDVAIGIVRAGVNKASPCYNPPHIYNI